MKAKRTAVSALWLFLLSSLAGRNRLLRVSLCPKGKATAQSWARSCLIVLIVLELRLAIGGELTSDRSPLVMALR
jgi:hypothetical protein